MLKLIYNPYMKTVNYQFRNDENAEWKDVNEFSAFCNQEYLGWDCVKKALSMNYEDYYATINEKDNLSGEKHSEKKYIYFKGTECHKQELGEMIPEFSINVENGDFLCKKEDFIRLYNKIIVNDKSINKNIAQKSNEIIKDLFILFDNEETGLFKSSVLKKRKGEWIRNLEFKEKQYLENPLEVDVSDEELFKTLEEKTNSYKDEIQRLEVLHNIIIGKHADLASKIDENKLVNCILSAIESAVDTDKIILKLEKKINNCDWTDKLTAEQYSAAICEKIDGEIKSLSRNTKGKIKQSVTKQLKNYNNESIKRLKKYTDIYKVISFSEYCKRKKSGLVVQELEDYELVSKIRNGEKTKPSLNGEETKHINEDYGGTEGFINEVKKAIQAFYIDQMNVFLEDTLGYVRTNVLLYFVNDEYIDIRDLENEINVCEYAIRLLKEKYIKVEQLRKNPPCFSSEEKIVLNEEDASDEETVSDDFDDTLQGYPADDNEETRLGVNVSDGGASEEYLIDYEEIKKRIEDAWKCTVQIRIKGVAKDTEYILYESETYLSKNIQKYKTEIDNATILVDIVGGKQLLARIKSNRINSKMDLTKLPEEIISANRTILDKYSKNQKKRAK